MVAGLFKTNKIRRSEDTSQTQSKEAKTWTAKRSSFGPTLIRSSRKRTEGTLGRGDNHPRTSTRRSRADGAHGPAALGSARG